MSGTATAWWQDFVGTKKVIALWSGPCCWAFSMRPALCSMSGFVRASALSKREELAEFLGPYREDALSAHPWKTWAEAGNATDEASSVCPAAKAAGVKARTCRGSHCGPNSWWKLLTTTCREPLPSYGAVSQMADRQEAERLHLCAARSGSTAGTGRDLSRTAVKPAPATYLLFLLSSLFLAPLPPFTRWIVIGVGSFLRRPQCFGHMT